MKFSKSILLSICVCATALASSVLAQAQTTVTPTQPLASLTNTIATVSSNAPSLIAPLETAYGWFTSFNPSNNWGGTHGYIETGAAYQNQLQFANALELGYNVYSASTNAGLTLSDNLLTAGIAGTIVSDELDIAWRYDIHDVQLQFGGGAFYDKTGGKFGPGVFGEIQKKLTKNTHAYIRGGLDYEGKNSPLTVILGAGAEF